MLTLHFYSTLSLESLFNKHSDEKKVKYNAAAELRRATFTPIISTCEGIFDHEAKVYMKRLAIYASEFFYCNKNINFFEFLVFPHTPKCIHWNHCEQYHINASRYGQVCFPA